MTRLQIRRLNDTGIARMNAFIDSLRGQSKQSIEFDRHIRPILTGTETTSRPPEIVLADVDRVFPRRYDLSEYLHERIPGLGLVDPIRDKGLWAWLALLWFDQLAPMNGDQRKIGEDARWVPEPGWKYYRHLVLGAYLIYVNNHDNPDRALAVLHNPPHTPGELVGQLAAVQNIAQSKAALGAATKLYYDVDRRTFKRGSGGRGPGGPHRLRTVLDQLDRTFDLQSMDEDRLLDLLPPEFDRFK